MTRLLEEKREQLKKSKEQEKLLEQELETFRQEEKRKEKMVRRRVQGGLGSRIQGKTRAPLSLAGYRGRGCSNLRREGREGKKGKVEGERRPKTPQAAEWSWGRGKEEQAALGV